MTDGKVMPFWDHLSEIRNRLLLVAAFVLVFSVASYVFYPVIFNLFTSLLQEKLYAANVAEGFTLRINMALFAGLTLSLPVLIFEIVLFLLPALKKKEKVTLIALLCASLALFVFGVIFAYKAILPVGLSFLMAKDFFPEGVNRIISYESYFQFVLQCVIGFGICFQFPVVLIFLMKLRLLKVETLIKSFRVVVILILVVAAVVTPSADVMSQLLLAVPMILLYVLCIAVAKIFRMGRI